MLYPQTRLASNYSPNAFGPGIPPVLVSGSDRGDNGIFAVPSMAWVYRPEDSVLTYGLGVFTVAGFGTNYRADPGNPILSPQPPLGVGVGPLYSNFEAIEMTPTVSAQVTERLSIGGGPTMTLARLQADPLLVAPPNPDGAYPIGSHTRMSWGGGFQVGAFYKFDNCWNLGVSYKSTQWMEGFHFQSIDSTGKPRDISFAGNLPGIVSFGVGYTGFERWTLAADVRYIDYAHTTPFSTLGFNPDGSLAGLGFRSIFAIACGAQYQLTDTISLRGGYSYNQDPISTDRTSFNIASPVILQHSVNAGFSYRLTDDFSLSVAYMHWFQNSIEGPFNAPVGPIPNTSVRSTVSADAVILGATVRFGCKGG